MSFHTPFHQRASNRKHYGSIYIDDPPNPLRRPRRYFNWCGFNGMCLSFVSLLTLGLLSPLSLVLSLVGLRRPGKGMAAVGTLVSLLGVALILTIGLTAYSAHQQRVAMDAKQKQSRVNAVKVGEATQLLSVAYDDLVEYRGQHEGRLPADIEGNVIVVVYSDPWGQALRYEPEGRFALVRSAGPDREFLTSDDLLKKVLPRTESLAR